MPATDLMTLKMHLMKDYAGLLRQRLAAKVSIGIGSGPQIGIQKGPPGFALRTISARAVGAGRGCGDGASAGCRVIVGSALEAPAVVSGFNCLPSALIGQNGLIE